MYLFSGGGQKGEAIRGLFFVTYDIKQCLCNVHIPIDQSWWYGGKSSYLLLLRFQFKSRSSLQFLPFKSRSSLQFLPFKLFEKNEKESVEVGPDLNKKLYLKCRCLDLNRGHILLEVPALPTVSYSLPRKKISFSVPLPKFCKHCTGLENIF